MAMCPDPNKQDTLEEILISIVGQVKSWMAAHEPSVQKNINTCLESELLWAVQLLLCKGDQSRQNISVLRQGVLNTVCMKSKDFVCAVLMWLTEHDNVEFMIGYMEETNFCKKTQATRYSDQSVNNYSTQRLKRQYDLLTIYKVYIHVFCSPAEKLNAIFGSNDPGNLDGLSAGMKLFIVILRFREPVCCVADLSTYTNY